MTQTYSRLRVLVECALMVALGTVLANIKIFTLANGGSITLLSMVPFIVVSYRHGIKWGLFTGFVNSLLQMLTGFYAPPSQSILAFLGTILLDYVLAFCCLGLASGIGKVFGNPMGSIVGGTITVCFLRFLCSFFSGVLIWGSIADGWAAWLFSLQYNASYMVPETILTTVGMVLLYRTAPQLFQRQLRG